jgi:hypothetical protein
MRRLHKGAGKRGAGLEVGGLTSVRRSGSKSTATRSRPIPAIIKK